MGVSPARYVFRSVWHLAAEPDRVYAALADVPGYPAWWPQVRAARRIDDGIGELRCRSMFPYDLVFVARREVEDPDRGLLRAGLEGDLTGWSQWTVTANGRGTLAVFDEEVQVAGRGLRAAGLVGRSLLRANHDLMMRGGERGLRQHLAK